ncbi:MAG: DUF4136 domain-containing protein [Candidatus Aminicenantes bacterium]|jgi:hypothetical protein
MKKWNLSLMVALISLAVSCSSVSVRYDYERDVDFTQFKTFDFYPVPQELSTSELVLKRIGNAIAREMTTKGFTRSSDNPDLLIAAHTEVKDKVNVTSYGYGYAPYYRWGYWGAPGNVDVRQYEEGSLIIDIVDNAEDELVWRGVASKSLPSNPTPEKIDKIIDQVVTKAMENFPPPTQ